MRKEREKKKGKRGRKKKERKDCALAWSAMGGKGQCREKGEEEGERGRKKERKKGTGEDQIRFASPDPLSFSSSSIKSDFSGSSSALQSKTEEWSSSPFTVVERVLYCFSDVTVSNNLFAMFKVGVNSGEVFMADLKKLDRVSPWVCFGDGRKGSNGKKEGSNFKNIKSHGRRVFCSKGGDLELWSEVKMGSYRNGEDGLGERVFRRNLMGRLKDIGGCRVTQMAFGGIKMVLAGKDQQSVEVWQSSVRI